MHNRDYMKNSCQPVLEVNKGTKKKKKALNLPIDCVSLFQSIDLSKLVKYKGENRMHRST